jgi:hypothetical protein
MADELLSRRVEVTFVARPPARQIAAAVGVSDVEVVDGRVRCLVRGSFQPLLEALRGYEVIDFTSIPRCSSIQTRRTT